jgi:N-acetylglucosaminyldiphosphoundecaprenol N-acetyl-beta-D-mannosaminyltransferase
MKPFKVFGIPFLQVEIKEVVNSIINRQYDGKVIVTPNVDHVVRLENSIDFQKLYMTADVFLNDSRVLKGLSSLIGRPIGSLIPGSDLTEQLFESFKDRKDINISVIGAEDSVVERIKLKYNIDNIYHYNPPMGFHTSEAELQRCVELCKSARSDVCFLAVGSPKQEILASRLRAEEVSGCYLCIGASLLFLVGDEKRAPKFVQKLSLEWLFRLLQSPRRLARRYLIDGLRIFPILLREIFNKK